MAYCASMMAMHAPAVQCGSYAVVRGFPEAASDFALQCLQPPAGAPHRQRRRATVRCTAAEHNAHCQQRRALDALRAVHCNGLIAL